MSVTYAKGFLASGVACGLKSSGNKDLALVQNLGPNKNVAAVFTTNRCKANPILWSEQVVSGGLATAIVLNSGGANCYTGSEGFQTTHASAELVAELLELSASEVVVCSTGLIGEQLNREKLFAGVQVAASTLSSSNGDQAALVAGGGWLCSCLGHARRRCS